eukprot:TRINITY_DN7015_c0_g1_i4.p1 TRINITY_DN7015_c0_g1~~TRINITY_DN7015_c0_g1_i4.p1  ORF type:complete len:127 (-),score=13.03 TRINITY_DN7015_c0_g1_i4:307-687(-)
MAVLLPSHSLLLLWLLLHLVTVVSIVGKIFSVIQGPPLNSFMFGLRLCMAKFPHVICSACRLAFLLLLLPPRRFLSFGFSPRKERKRNGIMESICLPGFSLKNDLGNFVISSYLEKVQGKLVFFWR